MNGCGSHIFALSVCLVSSSHSGRGGGSDFTCGRTPKTQVRGWIFRDGGIFSVGQTHIFQRHPLFERVSVAPFSGRTMTGFIEVRENPLIVRLSRFPRREQLRRRGGHRFGSGSQGQPHPPVPQLQGCTPQPSAIFLLLSSSLWLFVLLLFLLFWSSSPSLLFWCKSLHFLFHTPLFLPYSAHVLSGFCSSVR